MMHPTPGWILMQRQHRCQMSNAIVRSYAPLGTSRGSLVPHLTKSRVRLEFQLLNIISPQTISILSSLTEMPFRARLSPVVVGGACCQVEALTCWGWRRPHLPAIHGLYSNVVALMAKLPLPTRRRWKMDPYLMEFDRHIISALYQVSSLG